MAAGTRIANLQLYIAQTPDDPFPRYGLAMEYRTLGRLEKAQAIFDDLVAKFPDYVATYLMSGSTLLELGRNQEARDMFERGIEVSGRKGDHHARNELQAALASLRSGE